MLTVKAPIELACARGIASPQEGFCERIRGNYQWMAVQVDEEELLHLVTTPPEVYLEESGMTSIVQNTRIENRQEQKLEMINNLLNRISLTENVSLTYHDRVYITDVLHKLGIKDARQFMKRVQMQKQETKNAEELTSLYWNHLEELSTTVQQFQSQTRKNYREQQNFFQEGKQELYQQILNRLQTGAIYQILSNFTSNYPGNDTYVSSQELQITEQKRMASAILLNQMKEVAVGEPVPFVFRHENHYENEGDEYLTQEENAGNQITQAVLFQLADQLYLNRFEKNLQKKESWLHMEQALYQSAENTFERMRLELTENHYHQGEGPGQAEPQGQIYEREIRQIRDVLRASERSVKTQERVDHLERERQLLERSPEAIYPQTELHYPEMEHTEDAEEPQEPLQDRQREMEPEAKKMAQREQLIRELHREYEREREGQERLYESVERYLERVVPGHQRVETAEPEVQMVYRQEAESTAQEEREAYGGSEESQAIPPERKSDQTQTVNQIQRELEHWNETVKQPEQRQNSYTNIENQMVYRQESEGTPESGIDGELEIPQTIPSERKSSQSQPVNQIQRELEHWNETIKQPEQRQNTYTNIENQMVYRQESEGAPESGDDEVSEATQTASPERKTGQPQTLEQIQKELEYWNETVRQREQRDISHNHLENRILTRELSNRILYTEPQTKEEGPGETPGAPKLPGESQALHLENRTEQNQVFQNQEERTELLEQELRQINQRNIENYQRYQQVLKKQQQFQKTEIRNPIEQTRMESLEALEHPERLVERYRERETREETKRTERVQQLMRLLPEDVRRVYEQIESAGAKGYGAMGDPEARTSQNVGRLIQDIHRIETENRVEQQAAVEQIQRVREHSGEILERLEERQIPEQTVRKLEQVTHSQVSLIHKSAENQVNEEFLQQVMEQNRLQSQKTVIQEDVQERRESTKRTIYQQDQKTLFKETQDLQELIRKGVQSQVGSISDQVYSNLEKRLQREKKRRGF